MRPIRETIKVGRFYYPHLTTMRKLIYKLLNTCGGRRIRASVNRYMIRHPRTKLISNVYVMYESVTDLDINRVALTKGLGYDAEWVFSRENKIVCDLGCHTGLFPLWLYQHSGVKPGGMAVDANVEMVGRAARHFSLNNITMQTRHGLVGEHNGTPFHVNSISAASSVTKNQSIFGEKVLTTHPPSLNMLEIWTRAGFTRGDLLKVDIEGSEGHFLMTDGSFARVFDRIVIEWHEPKCSLALLHYLLMDAFRLDMFKQDKPGGIGYAYFTKHEIDPP